MSVELSSKNVALLAKNETTDGVDASPAAANAVLLRSLTGKTLEGQTISLDYLRNYFGASPKLLVQKGSSMSFACDIAGSGTAGTAPGWDALLRGCGFVGATQAALTGAAQAATATTITLVVGAPATDDLICGLPITITGGTGNGSVGWVKDYNGTTKVATVWGWSGTTPAAASTYSIPAFYFYKPISTSFEGTSLYRTIDTLLFKSLSSKGNCAWNLSANEAPSMNFDYQGTYAAPTDGGGAITTDLTPWKDPVAVNTVNTFGYFMNMPMNGSSTGTIGLNVKSVNIDAGVAVARRSLIGVDKIKITDRQAKGQIVVDAVTVANKAVHTYLENLSNDPMLITHGTTAGNRFSIFAEKVTIDDIQDGEDTGTAIWTIPFTLNPIAANTEMRIVCF
jgi:hypothetical protein